MASIPKDKISGSETEEEGPVEVAPPPTEEKPGSRMRNYFVRFVTTWLMIGAFGGLIYLGHLALAILVLLLQIKSFHEIISIAHVKYKEQKLPWFRSLNWYFLFCANYYLYFEGEGHYFMYLTSPGSMFHELMARHHFVSFTLYISGFVAFVLTLKRGYYKFQFTQFGWTHLVLLVIVTQSHFVIQNIYSGLVWFILPATMVICNDIMAYMFGFFLGRTPLIRLSPKKTWEGYIGALFSTVIWAYIAAHYIAQYQYFICPAEKLMLFSSESLTCTPNYVFVLTDYAVPEPLNAILGFDSFSTYPIVFHALAMSIFSSVIAPFGGFFASGLKRAFFIKDFDNLIPGHGGVTDRMDCQFIMATFAFIYHESFIKGYNVDRLFMSILAMDVRDRLHLFEKLQDHVRTISIN